MIRAAVVVSSLLASALGCAVPARAAAEPDVTVVTCLRDGFEVRAAFSDNSGGAYILLQKGTSAYMCHSNPSPRCEKLN